MEITFRDKKLEKLANNDRKLWREFGKLGAEKYKQRLDDLRSCLTLEDARHLPGHYHELIANRKGQWACDLEQPCRLIFIPHEQPIPINEDGQYCWEQIKGVEIIEKINYHKEK